MQNQPKPIDCLKQLYAVTTELKLTVKEHEMLKYCYDTVVKELETKEVKDVE